MYEGTSSKKPNKQVQKIKKNKKNAKILSTIIDDLEVNAVKNTKLLDGTSHLYEVKRKSPPIRVYFTYEQKNITIVYVEMKKVKKCNKR